MIRNIIFLVLIGIVILFVIQNIQVVEFKFLFWEVSMSRALVLFATFGIGLVGGWLLTLPKVRKQNLQKKR
jgi:uncharacterized integral membrane protein